jgi:hypothetical protein
VYVHSWFTTTTEGRGQRTHFQELDEANQLLRPRNSLDPWLLLVLVRIARLPLRVLSSLLWRKRSRSWSQNRFSRLPLCFVWYFSLGGDFLAGLTVACILIPQSVSYGTSLARLSPTAGLVCHIPFRFLLPSAHFYYLCHISHDLYMFPIRSFRRLSPGYFTPCSVPLVS